MYFAIDFDGTCVYHEYPGVGNDVPFCVDTLKSLVQLGHLLILNTMRSGKELDDAVQWFKSHNIPLYGINNNPTQKQWTSSPKVYANYYIDDAAVGCPLIYDSNVSRPYVDWLEIQKLLEFK